MPFLTSHRSNVGLIREPVAKHYALTTKAKSSKIEHTVSVTKPITWPNIEPRTFTKPLAKPRRNVSLAKRRFNKVECCIHDLVEQKCQANPYAAAVCGHDFSFTYRELSIASSHLQNSLSNIGARLEDRVILLFEKSALAVIAMLGVLKSGASFVPLDPSHPFERLSGIIEDTEAFAIVTSQACAELAHTLHHTVIVIDQVHAEQQSEAEIVPYQRPTPDNAAYILFTSGSTGKPKGVIVEHANISTSSTIRGRAIDLGPGSRVLQYAAYTFDVSVDETLTTLIYGGCVCVPSEADRFNIAAYIRQNKVNVALLTPTLIRTIDPSDVPSLKVLLLGGEALGEDVNDKWCDKLRLFNVYGPTECSVACVMGERTGKKGPSSIIGFSIGGTCWIADPDNHDNLMPVGAVGELVIGGAIVSRGYLNNPGTTRNSYIQNPQWASDYMIQPAERFYKTGDLASFNMDGSICFHGRKDNQIKIRGQRIDPGEIEHSLLGAQDLKAAVVVFPKAGPFEGKLTCVLSSATASNSTSNQGSHFDTAHVIDNSLQEVFSALLQKTLPPAMIPFYWIRLSSLPMMSSGKTDRKTVKTWLESMEHATFARIVEPTEESTGHVINASQSEEETILLATISEVLGLPASGIQTSRSFVRNGGDSISAMAVVRKCKDKGVGLSISDIMNADDLRALASRASKIDTSLPSFLEETTAGTPFALSPVQRLYFRLCPEGDDAFSQGFCVKLASRVDELILRSAIDSIVAAHPMLRARFLKVENEWLQTVVDDILGSYTFTTHAEANDLTIREVTASPCCGSDIQKGPLMAVHLFEMQDLEQVLYISAHHLIVDLVSWRVILEDLDEILRTGSMNQNKTLSFQTWCHMQQKYAATLETGKAFPYQLNMDGARYWSMGTKSVVGNTYARASHSKFQLSSVISNRLMGSCNNALRTQPVEIMIGALFTAFSQVFSDRETPAIFVESHGREPWLSAMDVSRTVGWFTTAYPLNVPSSLARDLVTSIQSTKDRKRSVPANGLPYFTSKYLTHTGQIAFNPDAAMEVVFNFGGKYQQLDKQESMLRRASVMSVEHANEDAYRMSLFDVSVNFSDEQLIFDISFPGEIMHQERVQEMIALYETLLIQAAWELDETKSCVTTADFPLLSMDSAALTCFSRSLSSRGISLAQDVEELSPLTPLQQNMLKAQSKYPDCYRIHSRWLVSSSNRPSNVDAKKLRTAWDAIVERHSSLRTIFEWDPSTSEYISVVLKPAAFRAIQKKNELPAKRKHLESETDESSQAKPLHQIVLGQGQQHSLAMILNFSHVSMDACSRSVIMRDLDLAYHNKLIPTSGPQFKDYFVYTQTENSKTQDYWTTYLSDLNPSIYPTVSRTYQREAAASYVNVRVPSTVDIQTFCTANGVTLSNLMFATWAIILSRHVGRSDVCFGYVVSDRSANVVGIEDAVGLYINLLACRVRCTKGSSILKIMRQIQQESATSMAHQTCDLEQAFPKINQTTVPLFNTTVNIRNSVDNSKQSRPDGLSFELESFKDPWNYDFSLSVNQSDNITVTLDYRTARISAEMATKVGKEVSSALELILARPESDVESFEQFLNEA